MYDMTFESREGFGETESVFSKKSFLHLNRAEMI